MRIWHYKLITSLPDKQLKAMRYEIGDMIKQYPNIKNPLVKYANDYDIMYLCRCFSLVNVEMKRRNINRNPKYEKSIYDIVHQKTKIEKVNIRKLRFKEHNKKYLKQCLYNLQEKYDRGIITQEEWQKVEDKFYEEVK